MSDLTAADLERIEAAAQAAISEPDSIENARIINGAPELVLALVKALREARAEIAALRAIFGPLSSDAANRALGFDKWDWPEEPGGIIEGLKDANAGRVKTFNTMEEMLDELNASDDDAQEPGGEGRV